jgi:hypothetical protein
VLLIQIAAAALLILGSGLIFRALVEIDLPPRPRLVHRSRPRPAEAEPVVRLPRAA